MNDRQLRYALAVWRERSFSKAATLLNVSQPAVSEQIRSLEEEIGFSLFHRSGNGIDATYVGRTFLQHAEAPITALQNLDETARQLRGEGPRGAFSLGFSSGVAHDMVPRAMDALLPMLARVQIEVVTATTRRIQRFLLEKRLDVGLAIEPDPRSVPGELITERVGELEMVMVLPWDHPLGRRNRTVRLGDLGKESFIVNEPDIGYGQFVQSVMRESGIAPAIVARADNIETIKLMIASGVGIALLPRGCVNHEASARRLKILSIQPRRTVPISLMRPAGTPSTLAATCVQLLRAAMLGKPLPAPCGAGSRG